jgi:hypothetical protein
MTLDLVHIERDLTQLHIVANYGSVEHTRFQMVFRFLFAAISLLVTARYVCQFRTSQPVWHFEQKLTFPLLFLAFVYNNPFYLVHAMAPSRLYVIFDTISKNLFNAYFRFFNLALFDALRCKNRQTNIGFFLPKIGIVLALFVSSLVHGIYDVMSDFGLPHVSAGNLEENLRGSEMILFWIYVFWVAGSIAFAWFHVDDTDRYKFNLYVAVVGLSLAAIVVVHVLFNEFMTLRTSSLRFGIKFAVENGFVLLMTFFHWPCVTVGSVLLGKEVTAVPGQAFFVNNDDIMS